MSNKLTNRQHEVLDFICRFIVERSISPTFREIAEEFGFAEKAAYDHVLALERKEYIALQPLRPRSIRILKLASEFYGSVGNIFLVVAPKGTVKVKEVRRSPSLRFEDVIITGRVIERC